MKLLIALLFCAVNCIALDREAFTFTSYQLEARVEPEQQRLGVRGKITLRNDSNSAQKNAALQVSSTLSWRSIQVDGKAVQFVTQPYQSDIDHTGALSEAIVSLPREIPPKGTIELEIGYEGTIPLDATRLTRIGTPKEIATHTDWDQISESFTAVRGAGHVVWYPVAMEAASLSEGDSVFETLGRWQVREQQSEVKIIMHSLRESAEAAPILWCNGKGNRVLTELSGAQLLTADCLFQPLHFAVPSFVINNYEVLSGTNADIYYERSHKSGAEDFALAGELASPFVADWFGKARDKVQVLDVANLRSSPYENDRMLLTSFAETNSKQAQVALAHELTHAAFYSPREWIYEGLAHFAQALYRERQDGREVALNYMEMLRPDLVEAESESANRSAGALPHGATASHAPLATTFDEVYYGIKAPYVWWMLRDMLGDDALKKALAAYRPEQDKDTAYMQHLIEAEAKRDLGWFFDDWVYHDRGLPDFRVASVYPHANGQAGYLVTITIENQGGAGAEVPVTLRMEKGEMTKRVEVRAKASASIRMETVSKPVEVVVNDGSVPESNMENNGYKISTDGK